VLIQFLKTCEICLKFVKVSVQLLKNYLLFKVCFTCVSHVFLKLVKYFVLFKFVLVMFQFYQKGENDVTNLRA
jgi:hypothetical protein